MRSQLPPVRSPTQCPPYKPARVDERCAQLDRIEAKLDALLDALTEEEEEQDPVDLEGNPAGRERNQSQGL